LKQAYDYWQNQPDLNWRWYCAHLAADVTPRAKGEAQEATNNIDRLGYDFLFFVIKTKEA